MTPAEAIAEYTRGVIRARNAYHADHNQTQPPTDYTRRLANAAKARKHRDKKAGR